MGQWSTRTEAVLRSAGWYPNRYDAEYVELCEESLTVKGSFVISQAARRALGEFGRLKFDERGPGIDFAREPFVIDALLADGEEDRFQRNGDAIGVALFPLGEDANGTGFLAIDDSGRVFAVGDGPLLLIGNDIREALDNLVLGRKSKEIPQPFR